MVEFQIRMTGCGARGGFSRHAVVESDPSPGYIIAPVGYVMTLGDWLFYVFRDAAKLIIYTAESQAFGRLHIDAFRRYLRRVFPEPKDLGR